MKKKLVLFLAVFVLTLSLVGCKSDGFAISYSGDANGFVSGIETIMP